MHVCGERKLAALDIQPCRVILACEDGRDIWDIWARKIRESLYGSDFSWGEFFSWMELLGFGKGFFGDSV